MSDPLYYQNMHLQQIWVNLVKLELKFCNVSKASKESTVKHILNHSNFLYPVSGQSLDFLKSINFYHTNR